MPERPYFDESGEPSDAPGRFVHVDDLDALTPSPGLEFRPVATEGPDRPTLRIATGDQRRGGRTIGLAVALDVAVGRRRQRLRIDGADRIRLR